MTPHSEIPALRSPHLMEQREKGDLSPSQTAEAVRRRRLREDGQRSLSENLAEGIALSHKLMRFTGAARRS